MKLPLHPQFSQTLVHGFHTHLTIPSDFFSKYIKVNSLEKNTAQLKSESSEKTWKVRLTCRILITGWKEFALANNLQTGHVIVVRYEGDLVFHVSNLGPNPSSEIPSKNNGKKLLHPRTEIDFSSKDGDSLVNVEEDTIELLRKKKVKTNSPEAEVVHPSSLDKSCFVAVVTASSLGTDKMYLPQHFTRSICLTKKCCNIVLIKEGKRRSWSFDLRFCESSDTFYIFRGWKDFCDENGQQVEGSITFKLVAMGETLVLSFFPTQPCNDTRKQDSSEASGRGSLSTELSSKEVNKDDCSSKESLMEIEKSKCIVKHKNQPYSSYAPCSKRFVTFTLPPDYDRINGLSLPASFVRENSLDKPGKIILLGKDGMKWSTSLLRDKKGTMQLGKGWKEFVKANSLESGFRVKLIWEETTTIPILSLCSDREQEEDLKIIEKPSLSADPNNNKEKRKNEHPRPLVTLTIRADSFKYSRLHLPKQFVMDNNMIQARVVILLGKDGKKWPANLLLGTENIMRLGNLKKKERKRMRLGKGWKVFAEANDLKVGDSFTFKLSWDDTTPVLSLCPTEFIIDDTNENEKSTEDKDIEENNKEEESSSCEKEKNHSASPRGNQFRTVTVKPNIRIRGKMFLPKRFVEENSMNKPGMIYLLGKDDKKCKVYLSREGNGRMVLAKGWKVFAEENDLKLGQSVSLELIRAEDETPVLKFLSTESNNSKANKKESHGNKDSFTAIQTLPLTHEDIKAGKLHLTSEFMKSNGINRLGKITIIGENGMERVGFLLSKEHGTVTLGIGWDEFCEANGVKLGQSFTLEYHYEQDETSHVLKFSSMETN